MPLAIPLRPVPAQFFTVSLGAQRCQMNVYFKDAPSYMLSNGLYLDLFVDNQTIIVGTICQNLNRIVRDAYLGFQGDLLFYDASGMNNDPTWDKLGSTYNLYWYAPGELPELYG